MFEWTSIGATITIHATRRRFRLSKEAFKELGEPVGVRFVRDMNGLPAIQPAGEEDISRRPLWGPGGRIGTAPQGLPEGAYKLVRVPEADSPTWWLHRG